MIVLNEDLDRDSKGQEEGERPPTVSDRSDDPPPNYSTSTSTSSFRPVAGASSAAEPQISLRSRAVNHMALHRENSSIKGSYIIDPALSIPISLLAPLQDGETEADRKNVRMESRNGSVDVDIILLGNEPGETPKKGRPRTTLLLRSENGSVTARVHTPDAYRAPIQLKIIGHNGSIYAHIPRSFRGLLTITTVHGSIKLSDQLSENLITFSEVNSTRICFLGDFSTWSEDEGGWQGDELIIETTNGRVGVGFSDEGRRSEAPRASGYSFFGRFFRS